MKYLAIALFLTMLSACSNIREWAATQGRQAAIEFLEREGPHLIEKGLARLAPEEVGQWRAQADTSGDGKTSLEEWWIWITGGGLATLLAFLTRRITGVEAKESRKRTEQWEAIGETEKKLHDIELRLASTATKPVYSSQT